MYLKKKKDSHLVKLLEDQEFAIAYFESKDIESYNADTLAELESEFERAEKRCDRIKNLRIWMSNIIPKEKNKKLNSMLRRANYVLFGSRDELKFFESDLAFLILSERISVDDAEKLGFENEYLANLLEKHKEDIENPYYEYHFDETTGMTSKKNKNGEWEVLTYTPDFVLESVAQSLSETNGIVQPKRKKL